jgi:ubiquinol-cytochrome c reductase cytochrome b subunit
MHLIALHTHGSNNPEGLSSFTGSDKIRFHAYYTSKDLVGFFWFAILLSFLVFYSPNLLGHADNSIPANPLSTPTHIVPEWYFLPFYAILRSIPNKLLGVIAMFAAIFIWLPLGLIQTLNLRSNRYRPILHLLFWIFLFDFLFLMWLGAKPIESPYIQLGQFTTFLYFSYFLLVMIIGCLMVSLLFLSYDFLFFCYSLSSYFFFICY